MEVTADMEQRTAVRLAAAAAFVLVGAASGPAALGAGYTVDVATITVKGASAKVLTDAQGMTLYYFADDTATASSCTGGCAKIWPPLVSTSAPTAEDALPGKLAMIKTGNGSQVTYSGHLLYRYSGDSAAHQANGQGIAGKWWVAKVDLKAMSAAGTGHYDYGNHNDSDKGGY